MRHIVVCLFLTACLGGSAFEPLQDPVYERYSRYLLHREATVRLPWTVVDAAELFDCLDPNGVFSVQMTVVSDDDTFTMLYNDAFAQPFFKPVHLSRIEAFALHRPVYTTMDKAIVMRSPAMGYTHPQEWGAILVHEYLHLAQWGDSEHTDAVWKRLHRLVTKCAPPALQGV